MIPKKKPSNVQNRQRQQGLSLLELMISLTLGIFLIFGVIEVFVNSKQTYRGQDALSRLQENARFALDTLVSDIRGAGYIGCGKLKETTVNIATSTPTITPYSIDEVFIGYQSIAEQAWIPALPAALTTAFTGLTIADNTDIISVQTAGTCTTPLTVDMASLSDAPKVTANSCGFNQNDIVMVSDCNSVDIFRSNTSDSTGELSTNGVSLSKSYKTSDATEILSLKSITYFIANDGNIPSLFMFNNNQAVVAGSNPIALIEGVENMQIQYGIDTDDDGVPNEYSNASATTAWDQVVSARLSLLMRTIDAINADPFTLDVGGTNKIYPAGPMRKLFETTVQIRNRSLN